MENYWSSLVWQNGGDIISADHKTSLVGSDQAAGGIQFLQDLIWKDKVMPDPATSPTTAATRSSRARPPWRPTARGSCATHQAAGHRLRDRAAAEGPGRPGHLDQPDRRRRLQGHARTRMPPGSSSSTSPARRRRPSSWSSRRRCRRTRRSSRARSRPRSTGAKVLADAIAYAHLKPSFKGYDEWTTALQTELDANVFIDPNKTAKQARRPTCCRSSTRSSPPASDGRDRRPRRAGMTAIRRPATTPAGRAAGRRGALGAPVPRADAARAGRAVGRADPRHARRSA